MGKITNGFFKTAAELAGKKEELASIVNKSFLAKNAKKFVANDKSNLTYAQEAVNFQEYLRTSEKMCLIMRLLISRYPDAERKLQRYLNQNGGHEDTSMFKDMLAEYDIDPNLFAEVSSEEKINDDSDDELFSDEDDDDWCQDDEDDWNDDSDDNEDSENKEEEKKWENGYKSTEEALDDMKNLVGPVPIITHDWEGITIHVGDKKEYKRLQERLRYALNKGKETVDSYNEKMKVLKTLYGIK